jgi:hypothetical protein
MTGPKTLGQRYVEAIERGNVALRCRLEAELDAATDAANDRLAAPDALHKAARWYAAQGIAVFPCAVRGKTPATPNGFKNASTERAQIDAWWTANPAANIGAPTGILFDVVDIDGREGVSSVYFGDDPIELDEIGHSLTSRTAGHHVFVKPTGLGNRAGFRPGVDYRGAGGYVILPPSIGANGRRYAWTKPLRVTP